MEIVPLIKMHKRKILSDAPLSEENIIEKIDENHLLYILDIDGIEKDKPNLCTFQKLSKKYDLWLDSGPRNLGDVVDAFMAGATRITIRRELCRQIEVNSIREITENEIYAYISLESEKKLMDDALFYNDVDGLVNFNEKGKLELEYNYGTLLKNQSSKNKVYTYEQSPLNIHFWKKYNIENFLVDIKSVKEFEKNDI